MKVWVNIFHSGFKDGHLRFSKDYPSEELAKKMAQRKDLLIATVPVEISEIEFCDMHEKVLKSYERYAKNQTPRISTS